MKYPIDLVRVVQSGIRRTCACAVQCAHCEVFEGGGQKLRFWYGPLQQEVSVRGIITGRIGCSMSCRNNRCVRIAHCVGGKEYDLDSEGKMDKTLRSTFIHGLD